VNQRFRFSCVKHCTGLPRTVIISDLLKEAAIYKFYTLRSLPQFLISVILACPESFLHSRTSRKDSRYESSLRVATTRQAGMTLKTNIQFLTPCGKGRRVLHLTENLGKSEDFFLTPDIFGV
jgi:hypothetical protein